MKNFKKILAGLMAVATLNSMSIIGVSAVSEDFSMIRFICDENGSAVSVVSPDGEEFSYKTDDGKVFSNFDEDGNPVYVNPITDVDIIKEAIIILKDAGENSGTYYYNYEENELPVKVDDTFDTSKVETVITIDKSLNGDSKFIKVYSGLAYGYTNMFYDYEINTWLIQESINVNLTTSDDIDKENQNTTIGESTSITEFTVGESTYPRGDINLDGKVNTVDLLMLKKYLLGLMEW